MVLIDDIDNVYRRKGQGINNSYVYGYKHERGVYEPLL